MTAMLTERWTPDALKTLLVPANQRLQFPPASDRRAWEDLLKKPLRRRQADRCIGQVEFESQEPWPVYTATDCMRYRRDGSRRAMEDAYFGRRSRLARLAIAEACEGKGRFLDGLADGLWMICDEATWVVSAHFRHGRGGEPDDVLLDPELPSVDLFQAETAHALAEILALHGEALSGLSRVLVERVRREIRRRVILPVLTVDSWWWLDGRNNWSPWVASSTLNAACVVCDEDDELVRLAHLLMGVCDRFIGHYHADGGCDEGPMYWGVAAGALLNFLERLRSLTGGAVSIYDQPLIRAMGAYLHRAYLGGRTFMTFADAKPGGGIRASVVWRYGERVGDEEMRNLALLGMRGFDPTGEAAPSLPRSGNAGLLQAMLRDLWWVDAEATPREARPEQDAWLDGLQVWVGRMRGWTLAAKAGHNGENHNHNDVGQVMVVVDDEQAILDVGCGEYTAKTFSAQRYEIWFLSAVGHNVPSVDGFLQQSGAAQAARSVGFESVEGVSRLSMELAGCYQAESGIRSLTRSLTLDRAAGTMEWSDAVEAPGRRELSVRLLTHRVVECSPGRVELVCPRSRLRISFDPKAVVFTRDDQEVGDPLLAGHWGAVLAGLRFTAVLDQAGRGRLGLKLERIAT